MRVFLSAFRLPGEAQQIDRILVAFSEHCHLHCSEGRSGLLENAEVTYLLCFSIIMLNTDRHNPNIRADRKMTVDQFVRNNTNYGRDVNQTRPLSREFLEGIYRSISEQPIRTEGDDISQSCVTQEVLMDMRLRVRSDYRRYLLLGTGPHEMQFLDNMQTALLNPVGPSSIGNSRSTTTGALEDLLALTSAAAAATAQRDINDEDSESELSNLCARLLLCLFDSRATSPLNVCPIDILRCMNGLYWLVDADMFEYVSKDLLMVSMSVMASNHTIMTSRLAVEKDLSDSAELTVELQNRYDSIPKQRSGKQLQLSIDFLLDSIRLCSIFSLDYLLDISILLLMEFSGILKVNTNADAVM
jgi:hypothetical protein